MKKILVFWVVMLCYSAVYACADCYSYNFYMFSVISRNEFVEVENTGFLKFWKTYTNGKATQNDVDILNDIDYNDYKKLLAGQTVNNIKSLIIETAVKKNDAEMIDYLNLLGKFLYSSISYDYWDYPSKEEIADSKKTAQEIVSVALNYKGERLKERYALLIMRCFFRQGSYEAAVNFWNSIASDIPDGGCKKAMQGLYAGSLFKTGKVEQAAEIFAQLNDMLSVKYCLKNKRNLSGISKIYASNPNSSCLPFLVQDFVNNAQETIDTTGYEKDNPYYHPIYKREVLDFAAKANAIVDEGKTKCPQLWKTAAAMVHYLVNFQQDAEKEIDQAISLKGTPRMNDNARAIRLLIKANSSQPLDENYVIQELKWLESKFVDDYTDDRHYNEVYERIVYLGLIPRFEREGKTENVLLLYNYLDNRRLKDLDLNSNYYHGEFFCGLLSQTSDKAVKFFEFMKKNTSKTTLQKYFCNYMNYSDEFYNDIIGTIFLREDNMPKAAEYHKLVSAKFVSGLDCAPYMFYRDYSVPVWFNLQVLSYEKECSKVNLTENKRYKFALEINDLKTKYAKSKGEERKKLAYELGVRYYQASRLGRCWFLTDYGWSSWYEGPAFKNEKDFAKIAISYLEESSTSTNTDLQEKSLCGLSYIPIGQMLNCYYDENNDWKYVCDVDKNSRQYLALKRLKNFTKNNKPKYLGKCDMLRYVN